MSYRETNGFWKSVGIAGAIYLSSASFAAAALTLGGGIWCLISPPFLWSTIVSAVVWAPIVAIVPTVALLAMSKIAKSNY